MVDWKYPAIGLTATLVAGAVGYAVYFDYKRRNDVKFRKALAEEKKFELQEKAKAKKEAEQQKKKNNGKEAGKSSGSGASPDPFAALGIVSSGMNVLDLTTDEIIEKSLEQRLTILQELLAKGEYLAQQGPANYDLAARYISKAARLLPNAPELMKMIEQSYPPEFYAALLVQIRNDGIADFKLYLKQIKPETSKAMLVADEAFLKDPMEQRTIPVTVEAAEDIKEGEIVYTEKPVVSILCQDLEQSKYCFHTQSNLEDSKTISKSSKGFLYKSKDEMERADLDYERFYSKKSKWDDFKKLDIMDALTVRYFGKSTAKKQPAKLSNHVETMEFKPKKKFSLEETKALIKSLKTVLEKEPTDGLDLTDVMEDYTFSLIKGLLTINSLAFTLKGIEKPLRDSSACESLKEFYLNENLNKMVGVGFYQFTAYLKKVDEAESNVSVTYTDDHSISIQATKPIKKGDKLYLFKPVLVDEVN